jgi:hypothetical protein
MPGQLIYFLILGFSIHFLPAKSQKAEFSENDLKGLYGLAGQWKMQKSGYALVEEWRVDANGQLSGRSYKTESGKITPLESVRLFLNDGKIVFAPTTDGQNNEKEVLFYLDRIVDGAYVFENKYHDFPHTISYKMIGSDSLSAYIEGTTGNTTKRINFNYTRMK